MKNTFKRAFSCILALAILLTLVNVSAFAAKAESVGNIYLSKQAVKYQGVDPITSASDLERRGNDYCFTVNITLHYNPKGTDPYKEEDRKTELSALGLNYGYDDLGGVIEASAAKSKLPTEDQTENFNGSGSGTGNYNTEENIASIAWAGENVMQDCGDELYFITDCLCMTISFKASKELTMEEINNLVDSLHLLEEGVAVQGADTKTKATDGNGNPFTLVEVPALQVEWNDTKTVYDTSDADAVEDAISKVVYVDASGTEHTLGDTDYTVTLGNLSQDGATRAVTVTYGTEAVSVTENISVTKDTVQSIEVTTAPTKTTYFSGDRFDKTGMVVTATYASGNTKDVTADCTVSPETLKTENETVTISYEGKIATQSISVGMRLVKVPTAGDTYTYDGTEKTFTIGNNEDANYYTVTGDTKGTDAGTYTATVTLVDGNETTWANAFDGKLSWTINRATPTVSDFKFTAPGNTTYDGTPKNATVVPVDGVVGMGEVTVKYSPEEHTNYGDYTVSIDVAQGKNYSSATNLTNDNWKFSIGKATASCTAPTANTLTYNTSAQALVAAPATVTGGTVYYAAAKGTAETAVRPADDAFAITIPQAKDAGTYTVWYYVKGDANHSDSTKATVEVEIAKKPITVPTADSTAFTYNGTEQTYAIAASDDYTVANNTRTAAGTQSVTVSLKDADNTKWATELPTYTFTIAPKTLKVTANDNTITYGEVPAANGVTYDGFENDETAGNLTGTLGYDFTYTQYGNVGTYTITPKGYTVGNYTFNYVAGTLTVKEKEVGLQWNNTVARDYNGEASSVTATATGTVNGDVIGVTVTGGTETNAGTHTATAKALTGTKAGNYKLPDTMTQEYTINKAAISPALTATEQTLLSNSVVAGSKEYSFDLTNVISGMPDDAGDVAYTVKSGGTYTGTCTVTDAKLTFTVGTAQAANTTDSVVITVSSKNYADNDVTIGFMFKDKVDISGNLTLDNVNVTYGTAYEPSLTGGNASAKITYKYEGTDGTTYAESETKPTNAGTYTITASYEDNVLDVATGIPGHIGTKTATLTITRKTVSPSINNITAVEYTGEALTPTLTVTCADTYNSYALVEGTDYTVSYENNTKAGTATATITEKSGSNYTFTAVSKNFTIDPKKVSPAIGDIAAVDYTGEAQTPDLTVTCAGTYDGYALVEGTDYTVSYENNTKAGTATATITEKSDSNYTFAAVSKDFTINQVAPVYAAPVLKTELVYSGSAQDIVTEGSTEHGTIYYKVDDGAYSKVAATKTNAGTYTVYYKIEGDENHTDVAETSLGTVTIAAKPVVAADVTVTAAQNVVVGVGTFTAPTASGVTGSFSYEIDSADDKSYDDVVDALKVLTRGTEKEVKWTFTGSGNYTGTCTGTIAVTMVDIIFTVSGNTASAANVFPNAKASPVYGDTWATILGSLASIKASVDTAEDTDQSHFSITVDGADYDNTAVPGVKESNGTYSVKVLYNGTIGVKLYKDVEVAEKTVAVAKADASCTAPTAKTNLTYTGEAQALVNAGTAGGGIMQYSLSQNGTYAAAVPTGTDAGSYTVWYMVEGDGNHNSSTPASVAVTIAPKSISDATVTLGQDTLPFNGGAQTVSVSSVVLGGKTLTAETEYTVSGATGATDVGTYTVTVTGIGNYTGTASATWQITKADASVSVAPAAVASLAYTGEAQELVTAGAAKGGSIQFSTTKDGTYSATIPQGTNAGDYTVWYKVVGDGNHNNVEPQSVSVSIAKKDIANDVTVTDVTGQSYTGSAVTPNLTVTFNGKNLVKGTDYTVVFSNNTNAGTATATLTGMGNYTGTLTKTFAIDKIDYTETKAKTITALTNKAGQTGTIDLSLLGLTELTGASIGTISETQDDNNILTLSGTGNSTYTFAETAAVATATVTVLIDSTNYKQFTYTLTFETKDKESATLDVTGVAAEKTYDGSKTVADPAAIAGDGTTSYTYKWEKKNAGGTYDVISGMNTAAGPKDAGVYKLTVTAENDTHIGVKVVDFEISRLEARLSWSGYTNLTYDGQAKNVTASVSNKVAGDTVNVTVNNGTATNAGRYTATATGLSNNNYVLPENGLTQEYTIAAKSLTGAMVSLADETLKYTGVEQTKAVTVTDGKTLTEGTDYTVSGNKGTDAKTYTVTVTGKGNYTGTVEKTFEITKAPQAAVSFSFGITDKTYGDAAFDVVVVGGSGTGAYSVSSSNTSVLTVAKKDDTTFTVTVVGAGSAMLTVNREGDTNYNAATPVTSDAITVAKKDLSTVTIADVSAVTYNGSEQKPEPAVSFASVTLTGGSDFTYSYENNKNAGTATVTITAVGGGNYTGTNSTNFTINRKSVTATKGNLIVSKVYDGGTAAGTIESGALALTGVESGDTVTVSGTIGAYASADFGTGINVTITGLTLDGADKDNYVLSANSGTFAVGEITEAASSVSEAPVAKTGLVYSGKAQELVTAGTASGGTMQYSLSQNSGYSTAIPTGTDAGTYTVWYKVEGDGNHNSSTPASIAVTIAPKSISDATVTLGQDTLPFNGGAQTVSVSSVVLGGKTLTAETEYTVSGATGATDVGTYTVTVTGIGNYNGTVEKTFEITKAEQTALTVSTTSATFGTPLTLTTSGGSTNGTVTYKVVNGTGSATVSGSTLTPTKAGTVTVTATMAGNNNYETVSSSATAVTIAKAAAPTVTGISFNVYFGNTDAQTYDANSFTMPSDAGTVEIKSVSSATGDVLADAPTTSGFTLKSGLTSANVKDDAASWTVTLESENYNDATATVTVNVVNVTFTVGDAAATADNAITVNSDKLTYGSKWSDIVSKANNFTATVNGTSDNTQSNFKLYIDGSEMNGNTVPTVKADSASYTVKVIYSGTIGGKAYSDLEVASKSVTITKAAATATAPTARMLTYTGEAQELVNAGTATGGTVQYSLSQNGSYSANVPTAINAGDYTVYYKVVGDDNHNDTTPASVSVTIAKADRAPIVTSGTDVTLYTLDGDTYTLTYTCNNADSSAAAALDVELEGSALAVAQDGTEFTAAANGTVTLKVTMAATTNYNAVTEPVKVKLNVVNNPILTMSVGVDTLKLTTSGSKLLITGTSETALDLASLSYTCTGYNVTKSADGTTVTVKTTDDAHTVGVYTVDASAVVVTPVTVTVTGDTTPGVSAASGDAGNTAQTFFTDDLKGADPIEFEGFDGALTEAAVAAAGSGASTVTVQVTIKVKGAGMEMLDGKVINYALDITPTATATVDDTPTAIDLTEELPAPVKITVKIPKGFYPNLVEHEIGDAIYEYLKVNVEELEDGGKYNLASWYQKSFSPVTLMVDNTSRDFDFGDGMKTYNVSFLGEELPVPTDGTGTFNGWTFTDSDGVKQTTKVMTYELLQAMYYGESPEPNFTNEQEDHPFFPIVIFDDDDLIEITRVAHGKVIASDLNPRAGRTVTLTAKPDVGYQTAYIKATVNGKALTLTRVSENVYTFVMPRTSPVVVTASFVKASAAQTFSDVAAGSFCYDAVQWAVANGVTNGLTDTTFGPKNSCTRAQVVTFLWRAAGCPQPTSKVNPFTDVKAGAYYYDAVLWAVERGITNGLTATTFGTNKTVTRAQFVTFLYRAEKGYISYISNSFTDVDTGAYYYPAVQWAVANGITNGLTDTTFGPSATCNRGQVVTFLYRCFAK